MNGSSGLRLPKLKWLCRRGMKELDVLLERFIKDQAVALDQGAWPQLESLLAMEDDRLWSLVQNPATAGGEYRSLLRLISHGSAQPD